MRLLLALVLASITISCDNKIGVAGWSSLASGFRQPADASIAVSSLGTGNYPANNFTGFTTPATAIATSGDGLKYLQSQTNINGQLLVTANGTWRDAEITSYTLKGVFLLRLSGGNALYLALGVQANTVDMGIVLGFDASNPENSGVRYGAFHESNASGCITNWPSDGTHTITFGARGFDIYLKIDGVQAIDTCQLSTLNPTGVVTYKEYRQGSMQAGQPAIWAQAGARDISVSYFVTTPLFSTYTNNTFDPRDFGLRAIPAITGSISASSTTLNLNSAVDIRLGDQVIIEIGNESGAGAQGTIGVGGTTPVLHYADATARDADHTQADQTYAYLQSNNSVWVWSTASSTWGQPSLAAGGCYYICIVNPFSLIARVTAVDASPARQLTLSIAASVTATNANIYLDSLNSFYPVTTPPSAYFVDGRDDGNVSFQNMTMTIPSGTWYLSQGIQVFSNGANARGGLTISGQGINSTILQHPKGVPNDLIAFGTLNSNISFHDISFIGNFADNGYMFLVTTTNRNFGGYPNAINGLNGNNISVSNISCLNAFGMCVAIAGGSNMTITNSTAQITSQQRAYVQWQFDLIDCAGGTNSISNTFVIGAYLLPAFELFACANGSIINTGGTNALYSTNSSNNWTIDTVNNVIEALSQPSTNISAGIDQAIINVNDNAFHSGSVGLIKNANINQQGYVNALGDSLKFIQISSEQPNVTVQGEYPGGGGCTTALNGLLQAPNYNGTSNEYGSMAVYSDGANTVVTGIRVIGSAIGSPGHSSHWGNISATASGTTVTNNVVDVIQPAPVSSGNQTNAAFCP